MVVHAKTMHDPSSTSDSFENDRLGKKHDESLRWRSTGWTPLAYPASAILNNSNAFVETGFVTANNTSQTNEYFPLNRDVLRAATREMLILEGSINSETLELVKTSDHSFSKSSDVQVNDSYKTNYLGPAYVPHLYPNMWCGGRATGNNSSNKTIERTMKGKKSSKVRKLKRKLPDVIVREKKQKTRNTKSKVLSNSTIASKTANNTLLNEVGIIIETPNISAETLTNRIVERACCKRDQVGLLETLMSQNCQRHAVLRSADRKCVDQQMVDKLPVIMDVTNEAVGEPSVPMPERMINENKLGVSSLKDKIPAFVDVSIVIESSLRTLSYQMVSQMYASFGDAPLRLFLGYKSCSMKRDRILRILSDYLFDVSHAFFAWKQTEVEVLSQSATAALNAVPSFHKEVDLIIRDSLFDERALKKIAGIDDSSLLRHAVEISRSETRRESWEQFAKTATGRRLLSHHRTGRAQLVGRKRREQRVKRFPSFISCDSSTESRQPRSRASSIASHEDVAPNRTVSSLNVITRQEQNHTTDEKVSNLSEVLKLSLSRDEGSSWGVLLAREGDMCVVDRASKGGKLLSGDLILSVTNEYGKSVSPPSTSNLPTVSYTDPCWFKGMVNVFKNSKHVVLVVRRVGSQDKEEYVSVVS
mmetsp:Transcript_13309/g.19572  ORF Transcript_13309/g.19572 Transcript_13309/m.19572 type:complete len:646 (-) Transcript_13309:101-2038(-)|eukprot:CAMPEP_0194213266 /NCGR_PEP_ID=MMETSP0156-20130528/13675_1 /TAXON_ID=33649 /ORGANISM="Thalassionema nitzschioides, Strain L26-B" /LENGTH=645 /DNA_ID=CAMNT_0038941257 /DNA_START=185 /DNA_END=2122 /DNA_ORIENTATION=-